MNKTDQEEIEECDRIVREWEYREQLAIIARRNADKRVYKFGAGVLLVAAISMLVFLMFRGHP